MPLTRKRMLRSFTLCLSSKGLSSRSHQTQFGPSASWPVVLVPIGGPWTTIPVLIVTWPPVTSAGKRSSPRGAGPPFFSPTRLYLEPWQGHSNHCEVWHQGTRQPRWTHFWKRTTMPACISGRMASEYTFLAAATAGLPVPAGSRLCLVSLNRARASSVWSVVATAAPDPERSALRASLVSDPVAERWRDTVVATASSTARTSNTGTAIRRTVFASIGGFLVSARGRRTFL